MSTSLVVRNTSLLHRAKFFYNKYSRDQYPWSSKYPWIIGSNHQNEIQSLIYVLHGTFRMLSFLNLIQINPYSGVAALRTETYTKILSLCAQEYNNGVSSADHMVYEENRPNYGYGKISFPSNVGGVNDSLFQSPAYKALKSKQYNQILPIYAGGGVSTNMDHIISSINAECKLRSFKEKLHGKTMCMYAFAVDNWLHPSSKGIRKHTQEIKNQLLVSNDIVVSSIYRLPFDCTELGSLQAIVTCLTTFQYNDFLPNGSAKVCFSSAGDKSVRGLWQAVIYQDCDKLINDKVHPSHGAKLAKNKIHTVAINVYPASIHDISGLKDGEFNECLFVETMGNITNACRGLSLAQKLGFEVVIIGQPLGIAQLLYVYKYRYKLRFPHKIQLIVGGYLSSNTLMRFLKYDICNSIDISWISYYGTTDFFAAVLKTEYNETNGFVSTNPHKIRTQICARTNSLVLTYIDSNGDQTSINTNDYVSKELFEMNGRLYFEPKTRLEQWIINEWGEKQWRYLTGNATICNDIVYLQRRDDDNDDNETYDNNFYLNKGIAYLESDINGKDKDLESISSKFNMVELLPFSEFETKFHSNIFQTKPKYLYTQSNVSNANESSEQKIQFLHLSQSSEL